MSCIIDFQFTRFCFTLKVHHKIRGAVPGSRTLPEAGASYNPSFVDHHSLMCKAAAVELRKEARQEKVSRALKGMLRVTEDEAKALLNQEDREMERGLFSDEEEEEDKKDFDEVT